MTLPSTAVLVLGMTYLLCCILGHEHLGLKNMLLMWHYLPFLYSCVSFIGVVLLLLCTPVGIARLFTVLGELVVKPQFLRNVQEEYELAALEEMHIRRRLANISGHLQDNDLSRSKSLPTLDISDVETETQLKQRHVFPALKQYDNYKSNGGVDSNKSSFIEEMQFLQVELSNAEDKRKSLESQKKASVFRRNIGYPLAMLILVALTSLSAIIVVQNTLELLVGIKALPVSSAQQFAIGITSLSKLGVVGSALEITLILYLWCASVVGLYSLPLICRLRPRVNDTSFTQIIGNCALLLVLSSALPVLARSVGITNFDLLGDFGRIEWLGNFYVVLLYNCVFAGGTAFALTNKFTVAIRHELLKRFQTVLTFFSLNNNDNPPSRYSVNGVNGSANSSLNSKLE